MDNGSKNYSAEEKIFNLQLIVQKLEEELLLYRNGTTAIELLELIHEKDVEIETWRAKCDEKDDKLKKLAKTSGDVLLKFERLTEDFAVVEKEKLSLQDHVQELQAALQERSSGIARLEAALESMRAEVRAKDDQLGALRLSAWETQQGAAQRDAARDAELDRLRAELESALEKARAAEEQHGAQLQVTSDQAQQWRDQLRVKATENETLQKELSRWKEYAEDQERSIDKLQKRCATLVGEKSDRLKTLDHERQEMISHVQQFRESMSNNLSQREEALRRKDEKIRELLLQNKTLEQQMRLQRALSPSSSRRKHEKHAIENPKVLEQSATVPHKDSKAKPAPLTTHNLNALTELLSINSPSKVL